MKNHFQFVMFVFLLVALFWPCQQVQAQQSVNDTTNYVVGDTMYVAWQKTGDYGTVRLNALRLAIMGDTIAGGTRANLNRVYALKNGGFYWESDDIDNTGFPLRLVGTATGTTGVAGTRPPMLQMADTREDGTAGAGHLITGNNDLTMKNLFVTGCTNVNGVQTAYQPITFPASGKTMIIDNCVFQRSNFALVVMTGSNNNVTITNNKFRNLIESPPTQQWTGRGVSIWADQISVVMENNTFFNLGFACFQMENGAAKYLRFNHNTIVNVGRGIMSASGDWWREAYFANNLIINGWWEGESYADMHGAGRDVRAAYNGLFTINTLPSQYGTQDGRRIVIAKNSAYLDPLVKAKYGVSGVDTITRAWFLDPVSKIDYAIPYAVGGTLDGHMYVADTNWLTTLPAGMTNYLTDINWLAPHWTATTDPAVTPAATMIDSMWAFITQVRNASVTGAPYFGQIYTTPFYKPSVNNSDRVWPLPENFSYTVPTDPTLLGTDGLPLGDLNWFPTQKATFLANQAVNVANIEKLAGQVVVQTIEGRPEAESGGLSGTATISTVEGTIYWNYNQVGSLTWTFNVPTGKAGVYNTKWLVNLDNQGGSQGMVLHVNNTQINLNDWGATPFSVDAIGTPPIASSSIPQGWVWVPFDTTTVTAATKAGLTLTEGQNTVGVRSGGWNHLLFAEVDLAPAVGSTGTDTIKCLGADVVASEGIAFGGVGIPWVPSKFKSVAMGTAGVDTLTVTPVLGGTYKLRLFGQNVSGSDQVITVKSASGTTLGTATLPYETSGTEPDPSGNDAISTKFAMTAGVQKIILSGANVKLDYVQLIQETGVAGRNNEMPNAFVLEQNYPNPFNPTTTINFTLGKASNVKLSVYNILGQKVATLVESHMNAGPQAVQFDASRYASGVYFYRLDAGSFNQVRKMLLIK